MVEHKISIQSKRQYSESLLPTQKFFFKTLQNFKEKENLAGLSTIKGMCSMYAI